MRELYFRVDVNESIATGHIMRCLSIAEAALLLGYRSVFILADDNGRSFVEAKGYESIVLKTVWDDMESEIEAITKIISERGIPILIVDSYYVTDKYLECVSNMTRIIYIDDLGTINYPVAGIVCYANYYEKIKHAERFKGKETRLFLGCEYVPLRSEFRDLPQKRISSKIRNVLLLSGGSDQYHALEKLLSELNNFKGLIIDVVCGRYNPDYDKLCSLYKDNEGVNLYKAIDSIIDYMQSADLAISAGGTTLYELSACGTPTITYSFADNQFDNVRQFEQDGLMPYLGDARYDDLAEDLQGFIQKFQNTDYRKNISASLQKLVDGNGAERLVKGISADVKIKGRMGVFDVYKH